MTKNKRIIVIVCFAIAALCSGIVSYGRFYIGQVSLGILTAIAAACSLAVMVANIIMCRKDLQKNKEVNE